MNAEVETFTAEHYEGKDPQATEAAHITPTALLRTSQQCEAKAEVSVQYQHRRVWKTKIQWSEVRHLR